MRKGGGTLSLDGVKQQILYFIKKVSLGCVPKAHEVRKAATSVNYFQHMQFEPLKEYTGWKSERVFFKQYFVEIEQLKV